MRCQNYAFDQMNGANKSDRIQCAWLSNDNPFAVGSDGLVIKLDAIWKYKKVQLMTTQWRIMLHFTNWNWKPVESFWMEMFIWRRFIIFSRPSRRWLRMIQFDINFFYNIYVSIGEIVHLVEVNDILLYQIKFELGTHHSSDKHLLQKIPRKSSCSCFIRQQSVVMEATSILYIIHIIGSSVLLIFDESAVHQWCWCDTSVYVVEHALKMLANETATHNATLFVQFSTNCIRGRVSQQTVPSIWFSCLKPKKLG